jgi:hypothetical protein
MKPKYSNKVYDIIKVSKKSVDVIDKGKEVKVKKSNIKLVTIVEKFNP